MSSTNFTVQTHIFPGQHTRQYAHATRDNKDATIQLHAKQYTPRNNATPKPGGVTILALPAGSFPKEVFEPLWDSLLAHSDASNFTIRSIWSLDPSTQAASGVLNERIQGDDPSLHDTARDLLCMVNTFRTSMPQPIIGFGHSVGATGLLSLALMHPNLLASLLLVDPISGPSMLWAGAMLTFKASTRPDLWLTREAAETYFCSAHEGKWDFRCLKLFLEHGLRETPTLLHPQPGNITLTTTKAQEAWNYSRASFEASTLKPNDAMTERLKRKYPDLDLDGRHAIFRGLPFMRPEVIDVDSDLPRVKPDVLYIFPDKGPLTSGYADKIARTGVEAGGSGGAKEGRVSSVLVEGTGHLLPLEKPNEVGRIAAEWLGADLVKWKQRRTFEAAERDEKSLRGEHIALSEEWVEQSKLLYRMMQETKGSAEGKKKRRSKL
ncbi:hypothetical protein MBLNU230_g8604t1 [Neophaeotheca triangularis]